MTEPQGPRRWGDIWEDHPEMGRVMWTGERWIPLDPKPQPSHTMWAKVVTVLFLTAVGIAGFLVILDVIALMWRYTWRLIFG